MANTAIPLERAQRRHPDAVQAICTKLKVEDPAQIQWSYDWCVRIDEDHRAQHDKGIAVFLRNPDPYGISLKGTLGRKRHEVLLDTQAMAADPEQHPIEIFHTPRPEGPGIFLWNADRAASPGWNEAVITRVQQRKDAQGLRVEAVDDEGRTHALEQQADGSWGRAGYDRPEGRWQTVAVYAAGPDIEALIGQRLAVGEESVADLLQALGMGAHEAAFLGEQTGDNRMAPVADGRQWLWGEQVSDEEIAPYAQLIASKTGASSGSFLDVMAGHMNPANQVKDAVARSFLHGLARGQASQDALRQACAEQPGLPPLTDDSVDVPAFIEQHCANAGAPRMVRPVILPGMR